MHTFQHVLLALFVMSLSVPAHALTFRATLDPIRISGRPGQVVTREFRLTLDPAESKTRFKVHMQDWWRGEDGATSYYRAPGTLQRSCGPWVALNPVETDVLPGETLTARLTVTIAPEAQAGGYWCALTVDELPDPLAVTDGIAVRFLASLSVGVFVYVGEQHRAAEIVGVQLLKDAARVVVRNEGNTPLAIEGRFEFLRPGETEPVAVIPLARGTVLTEPIVVGAFSVGLPPESVLPSGLYLVRAIVDYGVEHYIGVQREMVLDRHEADTER